MSTYTLEFNAMGCHVQGWISVPSPDDAQVLENLPIWFQKWEAKFSRFRQDSELTTLNQQSGQWVDVSPALMSVIVAAIEGATISNGVFNPLILPALSAAGYDHTFQAGDFVPGKPRPNARVADIHELNIDFERSRVRLPAGSEIDLGGIAKGWAAQQAAHRLSTFGACLINAGGDMAAVGSPDGIGGWIVSVINPVTGKDAFNVLLTDAAIATSGRSYRQWTQDGKPQHHIIDPETGAPAITDVLSATVIASDAAQAEIWAKVAFIRAQLTSFPTLLVYPDGSVVYNKEFEGLCTNEVH